MQRQLENRRSLKSKTSECLKDPLSNDVQPKFSQPAFDDNNFITVCATPESNPIVPVSNVHLSKDLIEVTEYNKNGLKIINNSPATQIDSISDSIDQLAFEGDSISSSPLQPRLLRSSSYTLDRPSPILIEHFRNEQSAASPCLSNPLNSSSVDENSFESIMHQDTIEVVPDADGLSKNIENPKTAAIEVYQTDISVQQITVNNTIQDLNSGMCQNKNKQNSYFSQDPFDILEPNSDFRKVLKDVPDEYAHQIIDLLRKQQLEQKQRLEKYNHLHNDEILNERYLLHRRINLLKYSNNVNFVVPFAQKVRP